MSQSLDAFIESILRLSIDGVLRLKKAMSLHIVAARRWCSPSTIPECEDQHPLDYLVLARFEFYLQVANDIIIHSGNWKDDIFAFYETIKP